jgi:hypothetical protein
LSCRTEHKLPDPDIPVALRSAAAVSAARLDETAARLAAAISVGDMNEVGRLVSYDAIYEDRAVRVKIEGRSSVLRYLERSAPINPFGIGLFEGTPSAEAQGAPSNGGEPMGMR